MTAPSRFHVSPWVREGLAQVLRMASAWRAEARRVGTTAAERARVAVRLRKLIGVARRHEGGQSLAAATAAEGISMQTLHRWLKAVRLGPGGLADRHFSGGRRSKRRHAAVQLHVESARIESLALEAARLMELGFPPAKLPTEIGRAHGASMTARSLGVPIEEIAVGIALMVVQDIPVSDLDRTSVCPPRLARALVTADQSVSSLLVFHARRLTKSGLVAIGGRQ